MNPRLPYLIRAVSASSSSEERISIPYELDEIVRLAWRHFNEEPEAMSSCVQRLCTHCLHAASPHLKRAYMDTVRDHYDGLKTAMRLIEDKDSDAYKELEKQKDDLLKKYKLDRRDPIYKSVKATDRDDFDRRALSVGSDFEDADEVFWWVFAEDIFDGNEDADTAAAMIMLLSDLFLEESVQPSPQVDKLVRIFSRIKDVETALYCVKKITPDDGLVSLPKTVVERARQAGSTKSWHKKPLQDVINKLEPGLKWGQVFKRLSEMGDNVSHPAIKSIECVNDKLKITPKSGKHKPRKITYRTLTDYKKP